MPSAVLYIIFLVGSAIFDVVFLILIFAAKQWVIDNILKEHADTYYPVAFLILACSILGTGLFGTHLNPYFYLFCLLSALFILYDFFLNLFNLSCVWTCSALMAFHIGFVLIVEKHERGCSPECHVRCLSRRIRWSSYTTIRSNCLKWNNNNNNNNIYRSDRKSIWQTSIGFIFYAFTSLLLFTIFFDSLTHLLSMSTCWMFWKEKKISINNPHHFCTALSKWGRRWPLSPRNNTKIVQISHFDSNQQIFCKKILVNLRAFSSRANFNWTVEALLIQTKPIQSLPTSDANLSPICRRLHLFYTYYSKYNIKVFYYTNQNHIRNVVFIMKWIENQNRNNVSLILFPCLNQNLSKLYKFGNEIIINIKYCYKCMNNMLK